MIRVHAKVEVCIVLTDEDITDIVITALEGGIGYWACLDNTDERFVTAPKEESVSETVARILLEGGVVTLMDDEDHDSFWTLDLQKLRNGIKMFLEDDGSGYIEHDLIRGGTLDIGNIDAEAADCIIQYALFGELVYG